MALLFFQGTIKKVTSDYVTISTEGEARPYRVIEKKSFSKVFHVSEETLYYPFDIVNYKKAKVEPGDEISYMVDTENFSNWPFVPKILNFLKTKSTYVDSHRSLVRKELNSESDLQLGCSLLFVPPVQIVVERITTTEKAPIIRAKGSIKKQTGHTDTKITMTLIFPNVSAINDPRDGLRAILSQFMKAPFVPVVNSYLNDTHSVQALCLHDITCNTVANFPGCLQAVITCFAFDHTVFMPDEPLFINTFDPDLFEWYVKKNTTEKGGKIKPVTGIDSSLGFSYVPEEKLQEFMKKRTFVWGTGHNEDNVSLGMAKATRNDLQTLKDIEELIDSSSPVRVWGDPKGRFLVVHKPFIDGDPLYFYDPLLRIDVSPEDWEELEYLVFVRFNLDYGLTSQEDEALLRRNEFVESRLEKEGLEGGIHLNAILRCSKKQDSIVWLNKDAYRNAIEKENQKFTDRMYEENKKDPGVSGKEWDLALEPWSLKQDSVIVTGVAVSYQNLFSRIPVQMSASPAYQFLGSQDIFARVTMEVIGDEALKSLVDLFNYTQMVAREYRFNLSSSFLKVKNEVLNLFGMEYVFIDTFVSSTVENFPGRYHVEITLMDFNIRQSDQERCNAIVSTEDGPKLKSPWDPDFELPGDPLNLKGKNETVLYWCKVSELFKEIDLYPDLDLPKYTEVNTYLISIGRIPLKNPKNSVYVDPDFYFSQALGGGSLGDIVKMAIKEKPSVDIINQTERTRVPAGRYYEGESLGSSVSQSPFFGDDSYPIGEDPKGQWENEWSDMINYGTTGRMLQAFPTVYIFLIDEGLRIRWHKLWDNFYGLDGLTSVEVVRSRKIAADTAVINISNIYRSFTDRDPLIKSPKKGFWEIYERIILPTIDEDMKELHNKISGPLGLFPGARLHIRMGYGNNLSELPIVFNGTVTEVNIEEIVTMIAQGDAVELTNVLNYFDGKVSGFFSTGSEPKNLIQKLMLWGESEGLGLLWKEAKNWVSEAKNPVVHFGLPGFASGVFTQVGEIGQNIYPGNGTGLPELGVNSIGKEVILFCVLCGTYRTYTHHIDSYYCRHCGSVYSYQEALDSYKANDEPNLQISLHGKTLWDICQICAAAVPNYIAAAVPFEFRSTLFYGKPYWDLTYGYEVSYEKGQGFTKPNEESEYYIRPKKKPFMQWHLYSSFGNIIDNKLKVTSEGMFTNVIVQMTADELFALGHKEKTVAPVVIHADKDIEPHIQRTTIIDSQLYSKKPISWDFVLYAATWLQRITAQEKYAAIIGASAIRDYLKDMYQGEIIVFGDPTVKPHDAMYLGDYYNEIYGSCLVKQVVHQFSLETGFITNISPDAAVAVQDHQSLGNFIWGAGVASTAAGTWLAKILAVKGLTAASVAALKVKGGLGFLSTLFTSSKITGILASAGSGAATASSALSSASASIAAGVGLPFLLVIGAVCLAGVYISAQADKYLRSAQCVSINLLTCRGKELSAGIKGHRGITVGITSGPEDKSYADLIKNALPPWVPFAPSGRELERSAEELYGKSLAVNYQDDVLQEEADRVRGIGTKQGIRVYFDRSGRPRAVPDDEDLLKSLCPKSKECRQDIRNKLTLPDDLLFLAMIIYAEAEGQGEEGMRAVGSVVLNRLKDGFRPDVFGVISQRGQFSGYMEYNNISGEYETGRFFGLSVVSEDFLRVAALALKEDNVSGRTYFANLDLIPATSKWYQCVDAKAWKQIRDHIFAYSKGSTKIPQEEIVGWVDQGSIPLDPVEMERVGILKPRK